MTTPTQLIGITGYAGSGKDTVRNLLTGYLGYTGFAFADPIRTMLHCLLEHGGIDDKYIESREFKEQVIPELGLSYRQLVQTLGTEWGRSLHSDFWLRLAGAHMADLQADFEHMCELHEEHGSEYERAAPRFVISDVRFINEAEWIRARGGVIWRVERPDAVPVRAHASEAEIYHFKPDAVIDNSGDLEHLRHEVAHILALQAA